MAKSYSLGFRGSCVYTRTSRVVYTRTATRYMTPWGYVVLELWATSMTIYKKVLHSTAVIAYI